MIIGPTLFDIPLEEVFFFVIQTYNTSLLYLLLSKPTYQPTYLRAATPFACAMEISEMDRTVGHISDYCVWVVLRQG